MAATEKDTLDYGVEYPAGSGQIHYDVELRLPTIGDNIAALEEVGPESNLRLNVAMLARSLVKLGTIPKEAITYELLDSALIDQDFDVLLKIQATLKKKRKRSSSDSPATASPSSPSAAMASPNPA